MDIAAMAQNLAERTERTAELDRRDRDYGGLIPDDRKREEIARSVAGWLDTYRAETSKQDVADALLNPPDPREITTGRLMFDVSRAVKRWAKSRSRSDQDSLVNDAALLLLRWPSNGGGIGRDGKRTPILDLGGLRAERDALAEIRRSMSTARPAERVVAWLDRAERLADDMAGRGTLPLRRDWLDPETDHKLPSRLAYRALRAAVKQAAAEQAAPSDDKEISTGPIDIALLSERAARDAGEISRLPDIQAPALVSEYLDASLDMARAIVARAYPHASATELAEQWGISPEAVANALNRGAVAIRKRWPNPVDLLTALAPIGAQYRTDCERGALLALADWRDGWISEDIARGAVGEWRAAIETMPDVDRALLAAARQAIRRAGGQYGSELAERISASVPRLVAAEQLAAKRVSATPSAPARAGSAEWRSGYVTAPAAAQTTSERRTLYALCAADESAAQGLTSRIANTAHRVPAPRALPAPRAPRTRPTGEVHTVALSAQRAERKHLSAETARRVAADRERVRHLLDSGSANADEIRQLRAGIAAALAA